MTDRYALIEHAKYFAQTSELRWGFPVMTGGWLIVPARKSSFTDKWRADHALGASKAINKGYREKSAGHRDEMSTFGCSGVASLCKFS